MRCKYERTIYKGDNGFCILRFRTQDQNMPKEIESDDGKTFHFTAVGYNMPELSAIEVELDGKWQKSKYGLQLSVESCQQIVPKDTAAIRAYLSSGLIKGIGSETAKAIVARFGTKTIEVLDNDPEQLLQIKGIAKSKLQRIMKSYEETKKMRELTTYLAPYGVSLKKIEKIQQEFGDESFQVVKSDPFQLCKIRGFGFMTVDEIARKTKVSLKNPMRYAGAINYVLEEAKNNGHLFLPFDSVLEQTHELLNRDLESELISKSEIQSAIRNAQAEEWLYNENGRIYLAFDRKCEVRAAKRIVSMLLTEQLPKIKDIPKEISKTESAIGRTLADSQRRAVELCLQHTIAIMTGGPGVGKTTTLKVILDIYHRVYPDHEILLAAPTGKASRRMAEQTGFPAATLHSAMGITNDLDIEMANPDFLSADFVVVDECSMVDMRLAYALFERLKPGAKLLLVGDPDQLPAVGAGNVLREMIRSGRVPTAVLDTVFRQASNSRIALNAYAVNHNDTQLLYGEDFMMLDAKDSEEAAQLVMKYYMSEVQKQGIESVQIISPFKRKGVVGADSLNAAIRGMINPAQAGIAEMKCGSKVFRVGDRVIQTKNSEQVSNGEMGVISSIHDDDDGNACADIMLLDGREICYSEEMMEDVDLSYCISIHKSQGAEFPTTIIPLMKEHYVMLRRNLLYTAISRAKSKVIIVGQKQAVYMAIHKSDVDKRNTVLADRIAVYYDRETGRRRSA